MNKVRRTLKINEKENKYENNLHYNSSFTSISELVSHLNNVIRMISR